MRTGRLNQISVAALLLCLVESNAFAADDALRDEARSALQKAATYFRENVAKHGGYVYYYSPDLTRRLGEGVAGPEEIWVQPPGTPAVGLAYLAAYEATGDMLYLDAARETAAALIYGQLQSGGWTASIDFDSTGPRVAQYRNGKGRGRNNSTLDDGISQTAIQFLARLDGVLEFKDKPVHDAAQTALDALLKAQFANGAFPQVWTGPVSDQPIVKPSYPDYDWRTEGRVKNYWEMYTLNDGLAGTVSTTLITAFEVYDDPKCKQAVMKLGDFLVLAQMPDPQPAWAQQYNYELQPIWARRFEPAAITGGESQDALETLLKIYRFTGDKKYLVPIPRALAYLKKSQLSNGRLARYYELQSNKPLYMSRRGDEYTLTYDDSMLPDHYGWKVDSRLESIERDYQAAMQGQPLRTEMQSPSARVAEVRDIIAALDNRGRWMSKYTGERLTGQPKFKPGEEYLCSAVFSANIRSLSAYLAAKK